MFMAIGLCVLAILVTLASLRQWPMHRAGLRAKQERSSQLRDLARDGERGRAARKAFEAVKQPLPVGIDQLVNFFAKGAIPDIRNMDQENLDAGWVRRRAEVRFADITLEDLWMLLRQAESQRPPWRLLEIEIQASSTDTGRGRVVLTIEALERPDG